MLKWACVMRYIMQILIESWRQFLANWYSKSAWKTKMSSPTFLCAAIIQFWRQSSSRSCPLTFILFISTRGALHKYNSHASQFSGYQPQDNSDNNSNYYSVRAFNCYIYILGIALPRGLFWDAENLTIQKFIY